MSDFHTKTFKPGKDKEKQDWINKKQAHFQKITNVLETPLSDGSVSVVVRTVQGHIPRWAYEGYR